MATIQRTDFVGAIHHVFARGNNKQDLFKDESDFLSFLKRMRKLKEEMDFKLYAYCLMTNHFHLLIETGRHSLASIMGRLQTAYAMRFKKKYGTVGHIFQGPYGAKLCSRDAYFVRLLRYIHRNPVAASLVARPGEWRWSGHQQLALGYPGLIDESVPLAYFGSDAARARVSYSEFLGDGVDDSNPEFDEPTISLMPSRSISELAAEVSREHGVDIGRFVSRSRDRSLTPLKLALLELARREGHAQLEVARFLGCSNAALTQLVQNNLIT